MYNKNVLSLTDNVLARKFGYILTKSNYRFLYNSIVGCMVSLDNWPMEEFVLEMIKTLSEYDRLLIKFLLLCYPQKIDSMQKILGEDGINFIIKAGLAQSDGEYIKPTGYAILPVNCLYLIVSLPCTYSHSQSKFTDIYIGQDSMRLLQMVSVDEFDSVLDLCAGSGVQGMVLWRRAKKIDAVEKNHNALIAAKLNQMINGIADDTYHIYEDSLYDGFSEKQQYDCILSNPPYVPVPSNLEMPMCGAGGEDGMEIARKIINGYHTYLKHGGYAYMVLECIGDDYHPYILDYFESEMSQGVVNVSLISRLPTEVQIESSVQMAVTFYDNPNMEKYYRNLWESIFKKYSVTSMFSVVIEYIKTKEPLKINMINNYVKWAPSSHFKVNSDLTLKQESIEYYKVFTKNKSSCHIKKDIFDLLINNQDKSIYEIVGLIDGKTEKLQDKLSDLIKTLMNLEYQGVIEPL